MSLSQIKVEILTGDYKGYVGIVTKITKSGVYWVKVKSNWGNHHHPKTCKTFKIPVSELKFI